MEIEWDWDIVNPHFKPLIPKEDRYLIMYGGRGSSKSDFAAKLLIYNCLTHDHFRCIMIRKIQAKVKESCYRNLKDLIIELGLYDLFTFTETPVPRINCKHNGNFFVGAGTDNISSIKSTKDPSCVWWEEDVPDEDDFITVTTSLRTLKAPYIQEIFSINPECEGDYKELWFFRQFFAKHYENGEMTFSDLSEIEIEGLMVKVPFTVHHSTHDNNPHLPDQYRAMLMGLKETNPYYYDVYTRGRWGTRIVEGRFYKQFDQGKHTFRGDRYTPNIPLHISFDFNVQPYVSLSIWHIIGKRMICVDEIAAREPDNSTKGLCKLFRDKYRKHEGGLFIYGDATGKKEGTDKEKGHNDWSIIMKELAAFHPQKRVPKANPSVAMRGNFINAIFQSNEQDLSIEINEKCTHLTNDLLFGKQASDGTKFKERAKDKETGISVEKYHHFSDNMDYLVVKAFQEEYNTFKSSASHSYEAGSDKTFQR